MTTGGGQAVVCRVGSPPAGGPSASAPVPAAGAASGSRITIPACACRDRGRAAEPVRQPVQGARPRGRSRPACGMRPRRRRSPPATARGRPTAPRRGSRLRLPVRRQRLADPQLGRRAVPLEALGASLAWTRTVSRVRPLTGCRPQRGAGWPPTSPNCGASRSSVAWSRLVLRGSGQGSQDGWWSGPAVRRIGGFGVGPQHVRQRGPHGEDQDRQARHDRGDRLRCSYHLGLGHQVVGDLPGHAECEGYLQPPPGCL